MSLICADRDALENANLIGLHMLEDARLRIVFDDGRELIFKPRKRFYRGGREFDVQVILDIELTDDDLVDEILFGVRDWTLQQILDVIDEDSYKRLCLIRIEYLEPSEDKYRWLAHIGRRLFVWSGSLLDTGSSGTTARPGHIVTEIVPFLVMD